MDQQKPSDALTTPPNRLRTALVAIASVALVAGLGFGGYAVAQSVQTPAPAETSNAPADETAGTPEPTVTPVETPTQTPNPVVEEPPAPPAPPADPSKCPSGTTPGAVDASGNESNCQPTNNGQQCAAYDDQNNCTQWYKP